MAIAITNLTSGSSTSDPATTASISPANGSVCLAACIVAMDAGSTITSHGLTGVMTWELLGSVVYGSRRTLYVYKGTGTPSSGTVSINVDWSAGVFQEHFWVIDEVTGLDSGTPFGTFASNSGAGVAASTVVTVTVSGTPDAGDFVYAAFGHTGATADMTINGELSNELAEVGSGTNVRRLMTAYDSTPDSSPTPGMSWASGTEDWGGAAFIINVGSAGPTIAPLASQHLARMMRA